MWTKKRERKLIQVFQEELFVINHVPFQRNSLT